jgi:site-specific DNA-methyltransferase (adenine-specific)
MTASTFNILAGDNLPHLKNMADKTFDLIYVDIPFNTGKIQKIHGNSYKDSFDDLVGFLEPRLVEAKRTLKDSGSFFLHADYREIHYVKVHLDKLFGRENFINEIVWSYDYGGRSKTRWSQKHDTILFYAKDHTNYTFNYDAIDRIPYLAPGLVGPVKAALGKTPTTVWWNTIVPTQGKERVGYPTQKPMAILERIVKVHSNPGDNLLDFFAGSGSFGDAALKHNRNVTLIDDNPQAISVMVNRLSKYLPQPTKQQEGDK